jgi:hypothetical protein
MKQHDLTKNIAIIALLVLVSFKQDSSAEKISFQSDKLYPEGISFDDKRELVYLSSLSLGKLISVDKKEFVKRYAMIQG